MCNKVSVSKTHWKCLRMDSHLAGGKGWMGIGGRRNCMYKMWWCESIESSQSLVSSWLGCDMVGGEIGQRDCWLENFRFPHETQVEFNHFLETETSRDKAIKIFPSFTSVLFHVAVSFLSLQQAFSASQFIQEIQPSFNFTPEFTCYRSSSC